MAESMKGLKRTCRCGELKEDHIGQTVTVMGWVQKQRNKGGIIFVDLRDRAGIVQIIFEEADCGADNFAKAEKLRSEYVAAVVGKVERRAGAVNENLATGRIEIRAEQVRILSEAETPPFPVEADIKTKEELRLKYRYLDLRRPNLQKNLVLRSKITNSIRTFLCAEGFLEIETPILNKSTPEGARDYLVPSRVHPGSFYALPQSPQIFKQLLMCSGYDRYFQIARCFRDEDLRADRQPEFTQVDLEMSFVDVDDVIDATERMVAYVCKEAIGLDVPLPIRRMSWIEAMNRFGTDKPDTRFDMELMDVSEAVRDCGYSVFSDAVRSQGAVRGINVKGQAGMARKKIDALVEFAKGYGAKGLSWLSVMPDGSCKSPFAKFMAGDEIEELINEMKGEPGDLLIFAAGAREMVSSVLGALRVELAKQLGLIDENRFDFLWVTQFPEFEWNEEEQRYYAMHHPFTMPMEEDLEGVDELDDRKNKLDEMRAKAYDIVLNGVELGGGSVRIHQGDVQEQIFKALGFTEEEAHRQFGFLLDAFKYGVPPHAGLAIGLDRFVMLLAKADNIREVIAFPKVKDASCLMSEAPGAVDEKQLEELRLRITE